ncbi:MAG: hypothetical protein E7347_02160 [Clostridiales bacterium]|nr:hypothetical protein [Clostridiales bacterium]
MSKRFTKISLTILTLVFAFCMSIAMLGVGNAYASNEVTTFEMASAVQVRQSGPNGIRFAATIGSDDYDKLKNIDGIEFGIILVPTDWISNVEDLRFGNSDLPEYDEENPAQKYFAKGVNTPVIDLNDYDDDGDETEYVLCASFINIKESNFARGFTAKAYYKIGNEYFYAKGYSQKNIFEVASKHLATAEFEEDIPAQKAVKDYLVDVVDSVTEKYSDIDLAVDGNAIENGVAYRGDEFVATATVKNPSNNKTLTAGVKLVLTKDDLVDYDCIGFNAEENKYTFLKSGVYELGFSIGSKEIDLGDLTIKRHGVKLNAVPTFKLETFVAKDYASGKGQFISLRGLNYWTDDENTSAQAETVYTVKDYDETSWLVPGSNYGHASYIYLRNGGKATNAMGDETVLINYTDSYGVTYSYEHVVECSKFVAKGSADSDIATNAIEITAGPVVNTFVENVPLTDGTTDLIRFAVNKNVTKSAKNIKMKIEDVNDANNFVYVYFSVENQTYASNFAHMHMGMRPAKWSKLYGVSGSVIRKYTMTYGWADYGHSERPIGSLIHPNGNQYLMNEDKYFYEMMGVSIVNSEVFLRYTTDINKAPTAVNLCPTSMQDSTVSSEWTETTGTWTEFKDVTHVNITIFDCTAALLIDTIGGQPVTAQSLTKVYNTFKQV